MSGMARERKYSERAGLILRSALTLLSHTDTLFVQRASELKRFLYWKNFYRICMGIFVLEFCLVKNAIFCTFFFKWCVLKFVFNFEINFNINFSINFGIFFHQFCHQVCLKFDQQFRQVFINFVIKFALHLTINFVKFAINFVINFVLNFFINFTTTLMVFQN